jgi:GTP-binding protein
LSDIDLEANKTLSKYKSDPKYISYGFEKDFGDKLPQEKPLFVLPISSVAHLNTEALRYALGDFVKNVKEEENEEA